MTSYRAGRSPVGLAVDCHVASPGDEESLFDASAVARSTPRLPVPY